jgi:hypothetical protein
MEICADIGNVSEIDLKEAMKELRRASDRNYFDRGKKE